MIGGIIFGPRSIFDPVMSDQTSMVRKFHNFLVSRVHISKTIDPSGMKPSPACSPQWRSQDLLKEGSEFHGGPKVPPPKIENSSDLALQYLEGAQVDELKKEKRKKK